MTSRWHRILQRLSRMSWDEARTRVIQEISKRLDLIAHRAGHKFSAEENAFSHQLGGEFFFGTDKVNERSALLREFLPDEIAIIREEADAICKHQFNLLGYVGLDYGPEIDWHLDAVHGKRAPLKPWYKIDYLDFHEVGDHKVIWELNRHQHLVTLAKAWRLSGEERYLAELVKQWRSWQSRNPYPLGINWASSLEVAFRSLSWIWVANLSDDASVASDFRTDLLHALALNGGHMERYLSTYFSPNTHLLGEAVALFFIGTLYPQFPHAERWRDLGWQIILQSAKRQVRSDGIYFEQALHYHVYALDFFLHARVLASRNGVNIPADFDVVIQKMLEVVDALSQTGPAEGFGDDDGGRMFNPRRNRTEHMTDPLALGAVIYGREPIRSAANLTEEAIWLFGEPAVAAAAKSQPRTIRSQAFEASGLYVLASADSIAHEMVVDAGPQGTGHCGHGHADALSILMTLGGRRFLVDPGTCVYVSDTNDRDLFRGTSAHNTLRVDGQDQAVPSGPFAWTQIPKVAIERCVMAESFDFLVASHDGYRRLPDPVFHRRFVFRGPGGMWLIRDLCEGRGTHLLESFWHFAEDVTLAREDHTVIATPNGKSGDRDPAHLALLLPGNSAFRDEVGSGPVSPAYGTRNAAPMVQISATIELPAECAVLLIAQADTDATGDFSEIRTNAVSGFRAYRYQSGNVVHYFVFADTAGNWSLESWKSDAEFLYCQMKGSEPTQVVTVRGSFVSWQDKTFVAHEYAGEKFEWSYRKGNLNGNASEDSARTDSDENFDRVL